MPLFDSVKRRFITLLFSIICLFISVFTFAQVNLKYRIINGYFLSSEAPVSKDKPILFVFEQTDTFGQVFQPTIGGSRKPDVPNFEKEMAIGIALPPTKTPPKLSVSKVFVQDSTLTVRYIRVADSTFIKNPQTFATQPTLMFTIPKQAVLKTKLVENGKVVQTLKKREE